MKKKIFGNFKWVFEIFLNEKDVENNNYFF